MDINFFGEPDAAPKPRDEMEVLSIEVEPLEDNRRARVQLEVTAFTPADRPNIEVTAVNAQGQAVGSLTVIETMQRIMAFTLHIREPEPSGDYTIRADLYYELDEIQHTLSTTFTLG